MRMFEKVRLIDQRKEPSKSDEWDGLGRLLGVNLAARCSGFRVIVRQRTYERCCVRTRTPDP